MGFNSAFEGLNIALGVLRLKLLGLEGPSIACIFWILSRSKSATRRIGRDLFTRNYNRKVAFISILHISIPWIYCMNLCN